MAIAQSVAPLQVEIVGLRVSVGCEPTRACSSSVGLSARRCLRCHKSGLPAPVHRPALPQIPGSICAAGGGIVQTQASRGTRRYCPAPCPATPGSRPVPAPASEEADPWRLRFLNRIGRCHVNFLQLKQLGGKSFLNAVGHIAESTFWSPTSLSGRIATYSPCFSDGMPCAASPVVLSDDSPARARQISPAR